MLLGRILLGGYFLYNAYNHFANLESLSGYTHFKGVPQPKQAVLASGVLLLLGGASILLGEYVRLGTLALVLFLVPVTFMMHAFWKETDPTKKMMEQVQFAKNMGLLGAVLIIHSMFISSFWF